MPDPTGTPALSEEQRQAVQELVSGLFSAYRQGRADEEREDRWDDLVAAMTNTNVTQQLVDAIERLAGGNGRPPLSEEQRAFDELARDVGRRIGALPDSPIKLTRMSGTVLVLDECPAGVTRARVFVGSGVYDAKVSANQVTVRSGERVARIELLDSTGSVVAVTGPES